MKDRWALCALGAWLMGSVCMIVVATRNFRLVDELLEGSRNGSFLALVQRWGTAPTRDVLRYLASELNREYFELWNITQLLIGILTLGLLQRRSAHQRARRILAGATLLVLGMLVALTPRMTDIGRSLDFIPRDPPPPELSRFWFLHVAYTLLEVAKLSLIGLATFWIARGPGSPLSAAVHSSKLPAQQEST